MTATRDFDWVLLFTVAVLCAVGLGMIYSVFHPAVGAELSGETEHLYVQRQLLWVFLGALALITGFAVPLRVYESLAYLIYTIGIIMLIAVLALPSRGETQRWLALGPLRLQPSEFMKIAVIFAWARILSGYRGDPRRPRNLILIGVSFAVPFLLVLKQPDLGTALVFLGLVVPVLYWRGLRGIHIFFGLSPLVCALLVIYGDHVAHNPWPFGIFIVSVLVVAYVRRRYLAESVALVVSNLGVGLLVPSLWNDLKPYQQKRIVNFLDPGADKLGAGWQVIQSKIAIGSGGFGGKGYLEGTQKALEFLPAKHTDFIFSVLGEELGFFGAFIVLLLFVIIIIKALAIAQKAKGEFASAVSVGVAAYLFFQVVVSVAMTTGMAPVTGIPLPFISYGGSSMIVSCFLVGVLLNCGARWYEY